MPKKDIVYESVLGELITGYIEEKRAVGYKFLKGSSLLKQFDTLLFSKDLREKKLPKNLVLLWIKKRANDTDSTRSGRV